MRHPLLAALIAAAAAALASVAAAARPAPTLAELLKDRVAGKPASCISLRLMRSSRIVEPGAIIYQESANGRWWVNQPDGGQCSSLRRDRAIVSRTPGDRLCRGDIIRVIDPPQPIEFGSCGMGDFTPYIKDKRTQK